jgi:hypothetical protein
VGLARLNLAQQLKAVSATKPAELLRRALAEKLELAKTKLTMENDVHQLHRLQGRAQELNELLRLLEP